MNSRLSDPANKLADANNSPGIPGGDKLSPSLKEVTSSVFWLLMNREINHNHLLVDGAFKLELHHRVIVWMTPVSQIEAAENFLGVKSQLVKEVIIGVLNIFEEGAIKPVLPNTTPSHMSTIIDPAIEFPYLGPKVERVSECYAGSRSHGFVPRRDESDGVTPAFFQKPPVARLDPVARSWINPAQRPGFFIEYIFSHRGKLPNVGKDGDDEDIVSHGGKVKALMGFLPNHGPDGKLILSFGTHVIIAFGAHCKAEVRAPTGEFHGRGGGAGRIEFILGILNGHVP